MATEVEMDKARGAERCFPPTQLFEEGWMLCLVLEWFFRTRATGHGLSFTTDAR